MPWNHPRSWKRPELALESYPEAAPESRPSASGQAACPAPALLPSVMPAFAKSVFATFAPEPLASGNFDPAPPAATSLSPVNSGKSASYGTSFGYPAETRSVETIIPPLASRGERSFPPCLTPALIEKIPAIFPDFVRRARLWGRGDRNQGRSKSEATSHIRTSGCRLQPLYVHRNHRSASTNETPPQIASTASRPD